VSEHICYDVYDAALRVLIWALAQAAGVYPSGEQALSGYPVNVVEWMGAQENATGQTGTITSSA
jgi:hypothetical protein